MPNDLTNYGEGVIGQHLFRSGTWTKPTTLYVALLTAVTDAEAGTMTEVNTAGTAYARVSVPCADANWTAPVGGSRQFSNANAITFPTPTASWGTVTHFALFDAAASGNPLIVAPLTASRAIANGDTAPVFAAATLRVSFTGAWTNYLAGRVGDHMLRSTSFPKPTALYVALFVGGNELAGNAYTRVALHPSDSNWSAPVSGNGAFANALAVTWPTPTAPWGTLSDVVLYDAATAGNEWCRVSGMSYAMAADAPTTLVPGALVATIG